MDNTEIDDICRKISACNRMMEDDTKYCVCCNKCYDKYFYMHTHKQSKKHRRNHNELIKYLCNVDDERVPDVILYMVDNN